MKILTNKYFILGNLLLLLISIPVTLFFIARQQELRGRAAPSSRLSFSPENPSTSTQCQSFNVDIMVDPGSNIVSIVDFYLKYDPTKLDVLQIKESQNFPTVVRPVSISSGEANMSASIGTDVTRAVQTVASVATVTFRPKATGVIQIQFDQDRSRVFSLSPGDEPTENVLFQISPANVTIGSGTCPSGGTPAPTTSITPTVTPGVGGGISPTPTTVPTATPTSTPSGKITPTSTPTSIPTTAPTSTPSGQVTPTSAPISTPTAVPTTGPTIPPTGGITQTLGIIGAVILVIIGGFVLLAL